MTGFKVWIHSLEIKEGSFFEVGLSMRKVNMEYLNDFKKVVGKEVQIDIPTENLTKHNIRKPQSNCRNPNCKCHKPEYSADVYICCTGCSDD